MHIKNIGARLITIRTPNPHRKTYQVIPAGDAVEIPDNQISKIVKAFIDGFVNSGELVEVAAPKTAKSTPKNEEK